MAGCVLELRTGQLGWEAAERLLQAPDKRPGTHQINSILPSCEPGTAGSGHYQNYDAFPEGVFYILRDFGYPEHETC